MRPNIIGKIPVKTKISNNKNNNVFIQWNLQENNLNCELGEKLFSFFSNIGKVNLSYNMDKNVPDKNRHSPVSMLRHSYVGRSSNGLSSHK